jgi:hypothetical protein
MSKYNIKNFLKDHYEKLFIIVLLVIYGFIFLKRFIYPDSAFDTINYHFFLGKNGFDNFPYLFKPNEFYPLGMHNFSPIIDMFEYIFYNILGYRLGTILSYFSICGTVILGIMILKELCTKYFSGKKLIIIYSLLIIPVFIINEALFQVSTYFTDSIYVFFLMLYLFILFKLINLKNEKILKYLIIILGLIAGLIITKLTNFIYIIPLVLVTLYFIYKRNADNKGKCIKKVVILFLLFSIPVILVNYYMILNFFSSSNPVFPYYNNLFKSIYFPLINWPFNFGPTTLIQKLFYPFFALNQPVLLGEVKDMFPDVKLIIIMLYGLFSYLFLTIKRISFDKYEKSFLFIFFFSFILWQSNFGYSRYGLFLEILGGMVCIFLSLKIFSNTKYWNPVRLITILFIIYMCFQSVRIVVFNYKYDISWRPTPTFTEWRNNLFSINMFNKYTDINYETLSELKDVDIVLQCVNPSSLYFSTIKSLKKLPLINIDKGSNGNLTNNINYISKRDQIIEKSFNKKDFKFAIVFNDRGGPDSGVSRERCLNAIKEDNINYTKILVLKEMSVDNFIGDRGFKLTILTGSYIINN